MGMTASDYGGGIPIVDVWRRDCGLAVGHLEHAPRLLSLPVKRTAGGVRIAIAGAESVTLAARRGVRDAPHLPRDAHAAIISATLDALPPHHGGARPEFAAPTASAYEAIWCAWGYERECTVAADRGHVAEGARARAALGGHRRWLADRMSATGIRDPDKYPRGRCRHAAAGARPSARTQLKPRLWFAPLAAAPGSDLLHDHTDMLLLDKDGAPQLISWWNSFYLCPAYAKTVAYTEGSGATDSSATGVSRGSRSTAST